MNLNFFRFRKRKSILIVTEGFTSGGLETHVRGEIEELKKMGWNVHLAIGESFKPELLPKSVDTVTSGLKIGVNSQVSDVINTTNVLKDIIYKNNVNLVHAHPFLSILPAGLAASITNSKFAITFHGPSSTGEAYGEVYLKSMALLMNEALAIAVSHETADRVEDVVGIKDVVILPNAVKIHPQKTVMQKKDLDQTEWLIASRLDSDKCVGIKKFISIALEAGVKSIDIAGRGDYEENMRRWIVKKKFASKVRLIGFLEDIQKASENYDCIAGMGRVILEAGSKGKVSCLIGYDGVKGVISEELLNHAAKANFSGRDLKNIDTGVFINQYDAITIDNIRNIRRVINNQYNQGVVWSRFVDLVESKKRIKSKSLIKLYKRLKSRKECFTSTDPWFKNKNILALLD